MADNEHCKGRHGGVCDCFAHLRQTEKPPIGLRPKEFSDADRKVEILAAMKRYSTVEKPIPLEWIQELKFIALGT